MDLLMAFLVAKLGGLFPASYLIETDPLAFLFAHRDSGDSAVVGTAQVGTAKAA